ncbi:predicted protein [Sclerotinia sclerotiorum 1980 UF-70]|uniref:Uncharacterized protein n=1 Tax=Sclerotinia sclerotiorum (strain ATCC 18683 / 1980 / Ss-1) TaxID=665079 RepID=A7F397_SCLS1|nr:predicted protein [Sclerotinia sclerotiorum 1980 UF-70]EDN97218.1 predicted protein [Sclerotinia sclerotiorum 1980 UF-70]
MAKNIRNPPHDLEPRSHQDACEEYQIIIPEE